MGRSPSSPVDATVSQKTSQDSTLPNEHTDLRLERLAEKLQLTPEFQETFYQKALPYLKQAMESQTNQNPGPLAPKSEDGRTTTVTPSLTARAAENFLRDHGPTIWPSSPVWRDHLTIKSRHANQTKEEKIRQTLEYKRQQAEWDRGLLEKKPEPRAGREKGLMFWGKTERKIEKEVQNHFTRLKEMLGENGCLGQGKHVKG